MADYRIFQYTIDLDKRSQVILVPGGARFLSVQMQYGDCQIWALVDTTRPKQARSIEVLPTGASVQHVKQLVYLGSVQTPVIHTLHIFERRP